MTKFNLPWPKTRLTETSTQLMFCPWMVATKYLSGKKSHTWNFPRRAVKTIPVWEKSNNETVAPDGRKTNTYFGKNTHICLDAPFQSKTHQEIHKTQWIAIKMRNNE